MVMQTTVQIRTADLFEDLLLAEHFYYMWLDNAVPEEAISPDYPDIVQAFVTMARRDLDYAAFVAEVDGRVVGSAGCQRFEGLYPLILAPEFQCRGYVWGVYVEPAYRQQGIATRLMEAAIAHLKSIGCTEILLNASPSGKPIYERLGFVAANAMKLSLN
ncbi:GNAT family N-acetyltransferase [Leptolyngbya sp. FACHB-16]|uniref:GNAT family N-acetyltransferase n=2 Tax=unclassified Leptolyngbya TaxID=2650499 RepID=UPI0016879A94|nr:GNAT family N-acetyltransferase [Leptolyngbya sp. FACHB-16]MBD1910810.1 GNAT family N-acetyltransferase [Leptolyngbya sp. FACHB-8]MBD2157621.1 GNAT family N-acetyltransferase [Leptolyngbya sp. FACHB-16]